MELQLYYIFKDIPNNIYLFKIYISAELLPPKVRSISNSIIICFAFLCGFFISKTFVDLLEGIGQDNTFFLYGGICIVGTLLTALFVPETRGKSIDEIQRFFTKSRARPDETQVESTYRIA